MRVLTYDGQGFWLLIKRLSKGRFSWWPEGEGHTARRLEAWQAQLLLAAVEQARQHGANVVAHTLRLDYNALKKLSLIHI